MILMGPDVAPTIAWLDRYTIMDDFTTADATPEFAVLGLHGEQARMIISGLLESPSPDSGHFLRVEHRDGEVMALRDNRISGAGGFLLLVSRSILDEVIERLEASGARRIDSQTYETLRIEAGQPAIGRELSDLYNPLEANLVQLISWTKGCYIGQEVIARLDTYDKVQRHLVGIVLDARIAADGADELGVIDPNDGKSIGRITSVAWSPSLDAEIALAYIRTQYAIPGAEVDIVRTTAEANPGVVGHGRITKLPFDL
jgi:folate-binding protein YgfZ